MVTVKAKTMFPRGVAVFAITRQGQETATKIKNVLEANNINCELFVPEKYANKDVTVLENKLGQTVKEVFAKKDAIVAVMATGIVVRTVAPLLKSKLADPAVVCVDVSGRFTVSLLSGHYGGANELTKIVAKGIGAVSVVTTASDVLGKLSVDELARQHHCRIVNPESLVAVNSALVDEKRLSIVLVGNTKITLDNFSDYETKTVDTVEQALDAVNSFDAGVIIAKEKVPQEKLTKPVTVLKPQTVAVGIGCRKVVNEDDIVELVNRALEQVKISLHRVDRLATVEIKKDSQSVRNAAKKLGLNIEFISLEELGAFKHPDLSVDSEIVKQKIGVGGVCEQAALIVAGKNPRLLLKKTKAKGVTVAIAKGE
ncbi:MAG: cobalt-precorrin 5A hydrolase [Candidatus Bathyarchaeota archaeon]|nr:cobalt-precorrin 5A hydrolase [Candidatus Bathyarchaeota archaeon]